MHGDISIYIQTPNADAKLTSTHPSSSDYGNSETDDTSDGAGSMEAIYFGNAHWQNNSGAGDGPWVGGDFECGMYYGGGNETKHNNANTPLPYPFVSLYLRGRTDGFVLKGGDATSGSLQTMYDGPRPDCAIAGTCQRHGNHTYQPMNKKGAIILATGGGAYHAHVETATRINLLTAAPLLQTTLMARWGNFTKGTL